MKSVYSAFAFSAVTLFGSAAFAAETLEKEDSFELPSVEAAAFYRTMKIERGQIENDESVFGYEVELEWYGVFGGVEACYDMTDVNGRRARYNEIESFLGYGYTLGDLTAKAAYVYKACAGEEGDVQAVEAELEYETPWVVPFVELECETVGHPGALYGVVGIGREWELTDWLSASLLGGVGFGNPRRNEACFEWDRWAFREVHVGAEVAVELCPHVKLVPFVDFYDYFTEAQRKTYEKFDGFVFAAGCRLVVAF